MDIDRIAKFRVRGRARRAGALAGVLLLPAAALAQAPELFKLVPPGGASFDHAGVSVALDGEVAVVGARDTDVGGLADAGVVHVYHFDPVTETWVLQQTLTAPVPQAGDRFGCAVAVDGSRIVAGARFTDVGGQVDQGSAHVFDFDGVQWVHQEELVSSVGLAGDEFGICVDVDGDRIAVGAWKDDRTRGGDAGSVTLFQRHSLFGWTEVGDLEASNGAASDYFGYSVALQADNLVVGASHHDGGSADRGMIYLFQYDSGSKAWVERCTAVGWSSSTSDYFGYSVALDGDLVLASAPWDDVGATDAGSATLFQIDAGCLTPLQRLDPAAPGTSDWFGHSVALEGSVAVIGARLDDHGGRTDNGSIVVFRRCTKSGTWYEDYRSADSLGSSSDELGVAVALSGDRALAGAWGDNELGTDDGSALIFGVRDLELGISPVGVLAGQTATLTSFHGRPQDFVILFTVSFDSSPLVMPLIAQTFDASYRASVTAPVPIGLSGHTVGFLSFTLKPCGDLVASNLLEHTF